jgi:hypothetical protein
MSGALPLTATLQVLAEAAARGGQVPHLVHGELQSARETVGLQLAHDDDEFVILQQVAVGVDQRLVSPCVNAAGLVVQLEQRQLAALAVDHAQVAHDAGQQLRLAAVNQLVNLALDKAPHLQRHLIKQDGLTGRSPRPSSRAVRRSFTPQGVASTRSGSCVLEP